MTTEPVITIKRVDTDLFDLDLLGEWGKFGDHNGSPVDYHTFACYDDDNEWYFDAEVPVDDDCELPELAFNDFAVCYGVTRMVDKTKNPDLSMG